MRYRLHCCKKLCKNVSIRDIGVLTRIVPGRGTYELKTAKIGTGGKTLVSTKKKRESEKRQREEERIEHSQ